MPYSDEYPMDNEDYYGENAFPHSVLPRSRPARRRYSWMTRRSVLLGAGLGLFAIAMIAIIAGTAGSKGNSSRSPEVGVVEGTGARGPNPEVSADDHERNTNELGTLLLSLYQKHDIPSDTLNNPNSPQGLAMAFVAGAQDYSMDNAARNVQTFALATFYYSTYNQPHQFSQDNREWISADNWLVRSSDPCDWQGVVCQNDVVVAISLPENDLLGTLPQELAFLDQLQGLELYSNYIFQADHAIFGKLTSLVDLDLDDNYIYTYDEGIPTEFAKLTDLEKLSLSYNLLQGPLDDQVLFQGLSQLTHLEIESNYLSGNLPSSLLELDSLVYFYARRNNFKINLNQDLLPAIPPQPPVWPELFALWIDNNDVSGTIPDAIADRWPDLHSFSITNTSLTGPLPARLSQLPLKRIWLYDNKLVGGIPTQWNTAWPEELQVVELHGNPALSGSMPASICNTIRTSTYEFKSLKASCDRVVCPLNTCCTECV